MGPPTIVLRCVCAMLKLRQHRGPNSPADMAGQKSTKKDASGCCAPCELLSRPDLAPISPQGPGDRGVSHACLNRSRCRLGHTMACCPEGHKDRAAPAATIAIHCAAGLGEGGGLGHRWGTQTE